MDEYLLNDLLECSVCLERLDTSSKVLPCQHTFCKKCLDEIVLTKKELRCPECRILVNVPVTQLPPNVLLMRILEGMKHAGNPLPKRRASPAAQKSANSSPGIANPTLTNAAEVTTPIHTPLKQHVAPSCGASTARALYDYQSLEPGDLTFHKGELITLYSKIDTHWAQGECMGKTGIFPLTFVQLLTPLPVQVATCRALYDFRMNNEEVEGCLMFHKDEILSVLRRVDENWIEGRLNGRIGIFPLAFVELNPVAKALMKLSSNEQPGPSRLAPPTPTTEITTPLIPTDIRSKATPDRLIINAAESPALRPAPMAAVPGPLPSASQPESNQTPTSDSTTSSSTTPNSSSVSSNSSTAASTPASPQQASVPTTMSQFANSPDTDVSGMSSSTPLAACNPFMRPQTVLLPTSHITTQQRDKRHSFTAVTANQQPAPATNRHSAEILSTNEPTSSSAEPVRPVAEKSSREAPVPCGEALQRDQAKHPSQRHRRAASDLAIVNLPAAYVALYPYKPHKPDELELKKGGVYLVTERCQDGWFKGTSNRTQKIGVFPGNYVTLAKPVANSHSRVVSSSPRDCSTPNPTPVKTRPSGAARPGCTLPPPELPPRSSSPGVRLQRPAWAFASPASSSEPESSLASGKVESFHISNTVSPPPNVSVALSPANSKSAEKIKEKKEKSGIMKRLAAIKRSKSPTVPGYSMDNPVFEDTSCAAVAPSSLLHSAHSRSGSCPTQLIHLPSTGSQSQRVMSTSLSARVTRQKERPQVGAAHFTHAPSRVVDAMPPSVSHRKSSSLDAGDPRNPKHLVPSARERFRCIVPYPPNSEYELELRVGDVIFVHRKRDDGWYKGTQQRTGKTGLFPASFVESYS